MPAPDRPDADSRNAPLELSDAYTRIAYLVLGVVLLLVGVAKAAGLLYVLSAGRAMPLFAGVKQVVYAAGFVAGGTGLLIAGRPRRGKPSTFEPDP